jgi:hypothetical protein
LGALHRGLGALFAYLEGRHAPAMFVNEVTGDLSLLDLKGDALAGLQLR